MAWNALVENREGENLTNAIESSDIGNKTLCLQALECLRSVHSIVYRNFFRGYNKHDI